MTRKKKEIIAGMIILGVLVCAPIFPIVWFFGGQSRHTEIAAYYSDDSHFHRYSATVFKSSPKEGRLPLKLIKSLEPGVPDPQVENEYVRVFSSDIGRVWEDLKPTEGMEIEFTGTFTVFYEGGSPAVLQITVDGREVLAYEDGKAALLEWAATIY